MPPRGRLTRWTSADRRLALEARPDLGLEDAHDLVQRRAAARNRTLHEAEADVARVVDQLERRDVDLVGAHLAVADHPVAGELKPGKPKLGYAHCILIDQFA